MQSGIHPADFSKAPLRPGPEAELLSWASDGALLADGPHSVIKLYYNRSPFPHLTHPDVLRTVTKEANALHLIRAQNTTGLALPEPLEMAAFPHPVHSCGQGYAAALRMTRMPGHPIARPQNLNPQETRQLLFDCGYTIGTLHILARQVSPLALLPYESLKDRFTHLASRPSHYITAREAQRLEQLHAQHPSGSPLLLHGDIGPATLLFDKRHRVTGVADWGEARIGPREDDFFRFTSCFQNFNLPTDEKLGPTLSGYTAATGQVLDPFALRLSTLTNMAVRILSHEQGLRPVAGFEDFLLSPFKEMMAAHLPRSRQMNRAPVHAPAPKPSKRLN